MYNKDEIKNKYHFVLICNAYTELFQTKSMLNLKICS